jgi:hypothetical protein
MIITHQTTNDGFVTMCWRYLENPSIVDDDTDFQMVNPYWELVALQQVNSSENQQTTLDLRGTDIIDLTTGQKVNLYDFDMQ